MCGGLVRYLIAFDRQAFLVVHDHLLLLRRKQFHKGARDTYVRDGARRMAGCVECNTFLFTYNIAVQAQFTPSVVETIKCTSTNCMTTNGRSSQHRWHWAGDRSAFSRCVLSCDRLLMMHFNGTTRLDSRSLHTSDGIFFISVMEKGPISVSVTVSV